MFKYLMDKGFDCRFQSHAAAILERDFPDAVTEITNALINFEVPIAEIIGSGGGETKGTQRMRRAFVEIGWTKKKYEITRTINGRKLESTSHEVDHAKSFEAGEIALEIEWNNSRKQFASGLSLPDYLIFSTSAETQISEVS